MNRLNVLFSVKGSNIQHNNKRQFSFLTYHDAEFLSAMAGMNRDGGGKLPTLMI